MAQIPQANLPNITATGPRGYLQWLRADQPGLYQRVLPQLRAQTPQLWSDATQTAVMSDLGRMAASLGAIGQDDDDDDDDDDDSGDDDSGVVTTVPVTPLDTGDVDLENVAPSEVTTGLDTSDDADSANTTAMDPSTANTVSNIVNSTLDEAADDSLAAATSALSDSQLENATAGLSPSATGTGGIGQVFSSLTSSLGTTGLLLLLGGGLLLFALAEG